MSRQLLSSVHSPDLSPGTGAPVRFPWWQAALLVLSALLAGAMLWTISQIAMDQRHKAQLNDVTRQQWVADRERCAGLTAEEQALSDCVHEQTPHTTPVNDVRLPG